MRACARTAIGKMRRTVLLAVPLLVVIVLCYLNLARREAPANDSNKRSVPYLHPPHSQNMKIKQPRPMIKVDKHLPTLSPRVISGVKKFVFFVGYPHSGHSIIGSVLDAHPHIVISHELMLMDRQSLFRVPRTENWTSNFFNVLYQHSYLDVQNGTRNSQATDKGYALYIDGLWQGRYDGFIDVIGDKSGGDTTAQYIYDMFNFQRNYKELAARLQVPIRAVHVVRNPYDMITTALIYVLIAKDRHLTKKDFADARKSLMNSIPGRQEPRKIFVNETILSRKIKIVFNKIWAALQITELVGEENVLTVHSSDLVHSPEETINTMCKFFGVSTPDMYLKIASEKVFTSVSRTRELTEWPSRMVAEVDEQIKKYKILHRYSFTSD